MVTTVTAYTNPSNQALPGEGYDGVVRVSSGGYYGTGTLLYGGKAVLTAAHLFEHGVTTASVTFTTTAGTQTLNNCPVTVSPLYDPVEGNNDLALVWLTGSAPTQAERYELYRDNNDIGQLFTLVGFGLPGTGATGEDSAYSGPTLRLKATNQFDADIGSLKSALGAVMDWTPTPGTQLVADFDNGTTSQDALGRLIGRVDLGQGLSEGLIAPGDSGGPAFIGNRVAGVASYTTSLALSGVHPDIDNTANSSFGEIAAWQRVSHYQQWIDQSLRSHYVNAPTQPGSVQTVIPEGNSGTTTAYFLLQFTGVRSDPNQLLSVDYATRDGTAKAGSDYLPASGTLVLYPGENEAVIPVEIIGDTVPEPNETFYLDVTHPVGGSFGPGVVQLTAMRTIANDDGGLWA